MHGWFILATTGARGVSRPFQQSSGSDAVSHVDCFLHFCNRTIGWNIHHIVSQQAALELMWWSLPPEPQASHFMSRWLNILPITSSSWRLIHRNIDHLLNLTFLKNCTHGLFWKWWINEPLLCMLLQALIMQWQDQSSCIQMTALQEFIFGHADEANQ